MPVPPPPVPPASPGSDPPEDSGRWPEADPNTDPTTPLEIDHPGIGIQHDAWKAARDAAVAGLLAILDALDNPGALHPEGTFTDPLEGHVGSPHLPLDVRSHWAVEAHLYRALGEVTVLGEEVARSVSVPPSNLLALVDPADGTVLAMAFGWGFTVVVLLYVRLPDGTWYLVAAAVAYSHGKVTTVIGPGQVAVGAAGRPSAHDRIMTGIPPKQGDGLTVAMVAHKPDSKARRSREAFRRLEQALPGATVFNVGGTPTGWGLIQGHLDVVVSLYATTLWDSVQVLLLSELEGCVATLDGEFVDRREVRRWFTRYRGQRDVAPIAPCVTGADRAAVEEVLNAMRSAGLI